MDVERDGWVDTGRDKQAALRERVGTEMWDMDGWPDKKTGRKKERHSVTEEKKRMSYCSV